MTGQALKLIAAKPDAVLIAGVGGPGVLPQADAARPGLQGHDLPDARCSDRRLHPPRQGQGRRAPCSRPARCSSSTRFPTRTRSRRSRRATSPPTRSSSVRSPRRSARTRGMRGSSCSARFRSRWRRRSPAPRRSARRCATRSRPEREIVGCQGVFNMSPDNHNGMDERARVLVTVKDGKFRLLRSDRDGESGCNGAGRDVGRACIARRPAAAASARFGGDKLLAPLPTAVAGVGARWPSASPPAASRRGARRRDRRRAPRRSRARRALLGANGARIVRCANADDGMGASLACGVRATAQARWLARRARGHAVDRAGDDRARRRGGRGRRAPSRRRFTAASGGIRSVSARRATPRSRR